MAHVIDALKMIKSEKITYDQAARIDAALTEASASDIPEQDITCVLNYIDLQLAHNEVVPEVKVRLERLHEQLLERRAGA